MIATGSFWFAHKTQKLWQFLWRILSRKKLPNVALQINSFFPLNIYLSTWHILPMCFLLCSYLGLSLWQVWYCGELSIAERKEKARTQCHWNTFCITLSLTNFIWRVLNLLYILNRKWLLCFEIESIDLSKSKDFTYVCRQFKTHKLLEM